jgi:hypothetical protein
MRLFLLGALTVSVSQAFSVGPSSSFARKAAATKQWAISPLTMMPEEPEPSKPAPKAPRPPPLPTVDGESGQLDVVSRLLKDRILLLGTDVNDEMANVLVAQLLYLANEDPNRDITLYINSPGGSVSAGLAIYDTMQVCMNSFFRFVSKRVPVPHHICHFSLFPVMFRRSALEWPPVWEPFCLEPVHPESASPYPTPAS